MMMKTCAIAAGALFFLSFPASAQTYLCEDFSQGIPQTFLTIDADGLTPSADAAMLGFAPGMSWLALTPKGEESAVAVSTSWYKPAGQSSDWLVTPAMTLGDAAVQLSWRAKAGHKKYRDGYCVLACSGAAATDEVDIALFTDTLFSVESEENAWTWHVADLSAYAGQTLRLAFVNNSTDRQYLYVDDIVVAVRSSVLLSAATAPLTHRVGDIPLTVTVYTPGDEPVENATVGVDFHDGSEPYRQPVEQILLPGEPQTVTLIRPLSISDRQTVDYTLFIEASSPAGSTSRFELPMTLTSYQRKVLGEELTGTWCSWCVRGIVMLDSLKRTASDWFVGMAVHSGDPMQNDYVSELGKLFSWSGLPNGVLGRRGTADPIKFFDYGQSLLAMEPVLVSLQLAAQLSSDRQSVATQTNLRFAASEADAGYRLAYAVIENNVSHPDDDSYYQNNAAYSGGSAGPMGGWENLPASIPATEMVFQEVARGFSGSFTGVEGSVPAVITAGEDIVYEYVLGLPPTVDNPEECEVIVMLLDAADGHVVNVEIARPALPAEPDAISHLRRAASGGQRWYDLSGCPLPHPRHGLNIVRGADGSMKKVWK